MPFEFANGMGVLVAKLGLLVLDDGEADADFFPSVKLPMEQGETVMLEVMEVISSNVCEGEVSEVEMGLSAGLKGNECGLTCW